MWVAPVLSHAGNRDKLTGLSPETWMSITTQPTLTTLESVGCLVLL
jgi:hypothetical protein